MKSTVTAFAWLLAMLYANQARADWVSAISASAPLNWYTLDETSGPTAFDHGSQGLNGTYGTAAAAPTRGVPGRVGTAVQFDGTTQSVFLNGSSLGADWSAEFVIKRTADSSSQDLFRGVDILLPSTGLKLAQYPNTNQIGYTNFGVGDYTFSPAVTAPLGAFIDLVYVKQSSGISLYIDGVLKGSNSTTISLDRVWIGNPRTDPLFAAVDEIVIYDRALSPGEILSHYNAVPEPSSFVLSALGAIGLAVVCWHRRSRSRLATR